MSTDFTPGWPVVVSVTPSNNEVVEFWRSIPGVGAEVVAVKAQHHAEGSVTHDYGPHAPGVEYWTAMLPSRTHSTRARP